MFLVKKNIDSKKTKVDICFEKVVEDLLMISIIYDMDNHESLSYWRLTNVVGMPPLEIGIDCTNGRIINITFYMDMQCINVQEISKVQMKKGNITVDTQIFTKLNDYKDIYKDYKISIQGNKLICIFGGADEFIESYCNDRIEIYLNFLKEVAGFAVCDLDEEEINMINSI